MMGNISNVKNLRIVWICHFMNETIKKELGLPIDTKQMAPWISLSIEEFRKMENIELHIIAPLLFIKKDAIIKEGHINYYFIKVGVPFLRRRWPRWMNVDLWSSFLPFNVKTKRVINKIKPDIVNLIGAENAYYSSSILKIKKYPVLVTIQGFVSLNKEAESGEPGYVKKKISVEKEILKKMMHFGIEATSMEQYIKKINPLAKMYWFHFPFAKTQVDVNPQKEYDIVFFARITKMKGIEDAIMALSKAKLYKPDILLEVIGNADPNYMESLKKMVKDLDVTKNIKFKGFIPTQKEMHIQAIKAKISILPTYNDTIPGTIVESMLLGLPVISYRTGGIPDFNKDSEHIIIVEQGDIIGLADEIIKLLRDPERQTVMSEKGRLFALKEFDNTRSSNLQVQAYKQVIRDFCK